MIITRTPLRISIGGGGTDLPSYYEKFGGFVISAAINKYIYITINRTFHAGYFLKYSRHEHAMRCEEIEHPLLRETLRAHSDITDVEIVSVADVPAGTGLGSSGAFTVGLLHALHAFARRPVSAESLAQEAFDIEVKKLGEAVGKQDHYIAAYGGFMCQEYREDGSVVISPLKISESATRELRESLMLFFTGFSRNASAVLQDQKKRSEDGDGSLLQNLHFVKDLGFEIRRCLEEGNTAGFGELMHQHWEHKKARTKSISSEAINDLYEHGRSNGAVGGKLVGAGGGGFLMFYTRDRSALRRAMVDKGLQELDFAFDFDGSVVLLRN